jgi:transposase
MRAGIVVNVTGADRRRLEAIISDRSAPQKHVWRAAIILATAESCGTAEIMRRSGKSKPVVWRWQARFMAEGVAGLTRDKTRKPGKKPLPAATVQNVVGLALGPLPGDATHWTGRMLAKAAGVSLRSVQRILEAHQLAPHRIRMFIGSNMQRHRHQEFIRFLNTIEAQVPAGKVIHAVVDNYATHKHPKVRQWLARHPRWAFHFTPTSASWLNAVEGFFAKLTRQRLKRGAFQSVVDLQLTINRFVADTNADPKPFVWTADPKRVLAAIKRGKQTLESIH